MKIITDSGFTILDKNDHVLAHEDHFDDALRSMKWIDRAESVRRVIDGAVCATKLRLNGSNFWTDLWRYAEYAA